MKPTKTKPMRPTYYMGSTTTIEGGFDYVHSNLPNAIEAAQERMDDEELDVAYIVKVVRVIRRVKPVSKFSIEIVRD